MPHLDEDESSQELTSTFKDGLFTGKVALVTGGGSGIGASCVRLFAQLGADVVVVDQNLSAAEALVDELGAVANTLAVQADVSTPEGCRSMVESAVAAFGGLHIAVNNAGISSPSNLFVADSDHDEWRKMMSVNLDGVYLGMRAQIPAILRSGGGSIINMSSVMGVVAGAGSAAYVTSKHGVIGLTKAAAWEYAESGIRVNAVGPGFIDTPLLKARTRQNAGGIAARHALNRLGTADEVAQVVGFLASPASSFVTGAFYPVDGGYTAQ